LSLPKITIRPGRIEDAENIHAAMLGIAETIGEREKVVSTPNDIRRFGFGERPAFETLIAEVDGAHAGVCVFFPSFSTYRGEAGAYVQDLYVDLRFRGLGIGAKLLQRVAALVRARGGGYIRLSVDAKNTAAQSFYAGVGFRHAAHEQIYAAYDQAFSAMADAGDEAASRENVQ
jgi:ribosomal protein S18 acetylase RimI-like enzyme